MEDVKEGDIFMYSPHNGVWEKLSTIEEAKDYAISYGYAAMVVTVNFVNKERK